ncbi:DNA-binding transcriptional regulator, LysR family [Butyrivibrio sp. Su6]|uniref:LysR family transcriptional regulator n=2 Tax=unclassified Butyrivibrio TaxID=2639466 RepID=UPI00089E1D7B|nr:LysR family transcriptional regulator [Butyrivibrio sp. Su6]SEG06083.1 DNA-binding transcriptional regulator, LysR family [Butyrivibrio sp. Su6]
MFVSQPTFSYQIKLLEEEVGFEIFVRNGKGATLTPAGQQFVTFLSNMREELKRAIEQGQNFSVRYKENITISMSVRQALYFLPEAIKEFEKKAPGTQITPLFQYGNSMDSFLKNESDVVFALEEQTKQLAGTTVHKLFKSHIYLICDKNDPLASKNLITDEDIYGRTLMVGGGSPALLRSVQQKLISSGKIEYFNSPDHDTTLTNIASGKGICLAPGFLNDHSGQFAWIPYDCDDTFACVLCTHKADQRQSLDTFIKVLQKLYTEAVAFPF